MVGTLPLPQIQAVPFRDVCCYRRQPKFNGNRGVGATTRGLEVEQLSTLCFPGSGSGRDRIRVDGEGSTAKNVRWSGTNLPEPRLASKTGTNLKHRATIFPNCYRTRRGFHLRRGAGYAERS